MREPVKKSAARSQIAGFLVMDVMRAAADLEERGADIIHMEVGQPGTPAPSLAREAVAAAINTDSLGYTLSLGRGDLRQAIAHHYGTTYGVDLAPARVVITNGSSGAFLLAFSALFDAGQCVGLPNPGYPCYRQILKVLDLEAALIDTGDADRWMPTPQAVRSCHHENRLAGLLVASPANPTGTMLTPERLESLLETCRDLGLWFISDEIYHGLTYAAPAATALQFSDDAIVINSFSKYFSMTGWRVGWMVVPERLVRTFERLAQNLFICAPAVSQVAALAALRAQDELETNRAVYAENRKSLLTELPKAGFDRIVPADGAFYLYSEISQLSADSVELARRLLEEAHVAVTPGIDFDPHRGHRYLRFSYARSTEDIAEGTRRLRAWAQR